MPTCDLLLEDSTRRNQKVDEPTSSQVANANTILSSFVLLHFHLLFLVMPLLVMVLVPLMLMTLILFLLLALSTFLK